MSVYFRKAIDADREFIITSIIEAEKSGSNAISYCTIFSITEDELKIILSNILDEDVKDQELCLSNFLIAEIDGKKAATLSSWIEKENGHSSSFIKSNLLMYFIDREKIINASEALNIIKATNIDRDEKALQIECVFTDKQFRGLGLCNQLIDEHIKLRKKEGRVFNKIQIILLKNNYSALKAYKRAGFSIVSEKKCPDIAILNLLSCNTKILMERILVE